MDGIKDIFDHPFPIWGPTNENDTLHSPLEKHYNDSLDSQSSKRSWEKVTYFYVGDFFVYNMALSKSMPIFKKKIFVRERSKLCIEVTLILCKVWNFLPEMSAKIFGLANLYLRRS